MLNSARWRTQIVGGVAIAVLLVVFVFDVAFGSVMLIPMVYIVVVAVTAFVSGPRLTAGVAILAFVLALLAGFANGDHSSSTYWLRVAAVCVVAGIAVVFSIALSRRERQATVAAARYQLIAENASDVVLVWGPGLHLEWVSPSVEAVLGWRPDQLIGCRVSDLLEQADIDRIRMIQRAVVESGSAEGHVEAPYLTGSGGRRWMAIAGRARLDADGKVAGGIESLRDIQDEVAARTALVESEQQYRLLAENTSDVVIRWNAARRVEWASPSTEAVLGWEPSEFIGRHVTEIVLAEDLARVAEYKLDLLAHGRTDGSVEARYATKAGGWRWMAVRGHALLDDEGRVVGGLEGLRDIEVEHTYREQLKFLAEHDQLSQLVNRGEFLSRMTALLAHGPRSGSRLALLYIDVDNFKSINDTWGHNAGDKVIAETARRIGACVRTDDIVARYGGDEFVAALPAVHGHADAEAVAEKVHKAMTVPIMLNDHSIVVTVSIGVALAEVDGDLEGVLLEADRALYAAKESGRNRTVVHSVGASP